MIMDKKIEYIINKLKLNNTNLEYERDFDSDQDKFRFNNNDGHKIKLVKVQENLIDDIKPNDTNALDNFR